MEARKPCWEFKKQVAGFLFFGCYFVLGDLEHADFFDPPLPCVGLSNEAIVELVMAQLFDLMHRRGGKPVETLVPPSVAMRASA